MIHRFAPKYVFPALSTVTGYTRKNGQASHHVATNLSRGSTKVFPMAQSSHKLTIRDGLVARRSYENTWNPLSKPFLRQDDYVNGNPTSKELGVSRTSIWKAIQRLEKDGVVISLKRGWNMVSGDILLPDVIIKIHNWPFCKRTM